MTEKFIPACADGVSPLPRVAAIHDLSCFGRCALTVIMPTLSAMGNQVVPVPTCLLSSHTGGFTDLYFEDMTDSMEIIAEHFEKMDLRFNAIYPGFLGSVLQIEHVKEFIERFASPDTLIFVDPVMGDDGVLYSTYTRELMERMAELCHGADVITPNLTEACFLTGTPYPDTSRMSEAELMEYARALCVKLCGTGAKKIVITGIGFGESGLCVCGMDTEADKFIFYPFERVRKSYPGTGDLYASVLLGALLRGDSFEASIRFAADFTRRVMDYSSRFDSPTREGVALEAFLGELAHPVDF
ncbi:MAG: pyridoxamine kinase [Clostridia bacterium]|nr:pyridoxamine kinase [Clostridia bacterium]